MGLQCDVALGVGDEALDRGPKHNAFRKGGRFRGARGQRFERLRLALERNHRLY